MHHITYKITGQFSVQTGDAAYIVQRRINDGPWEHVRRSPSPRASVLYTSTREACDTVERNIRADRAAATRLGVTLTVTTETE